MIAWGVQPDGTTLTPAPGMLVAVEGHWYIITHYGEYPDGSPHIVWLYTDPPASFYPNRCAPLAPAPTPGGLWKALRELADSAMERRGCLVIPHSRVARTEISTNGRFKDFVILYTRLTDKMLPLLDTARQHHGALLAYCAQPGWEAQHG